MNRQIIFRGQKTSTKEWVYGSLICDNAGNPFAICQQTTVPVNNGVLSGWVYGVIPETVGQLTGKSDSQKNQIYEGDIIEFDKKEWGSDGNIHVVEWDEHNAEWSWGGGCAGDMNWRTVIGNIHDNPKLLKDE